MHYEYHHHSFTKKIIYKKLLQQLKINHTASAAKIMFAVHVAVTVQWMLVCVIEKTGGTLCSANKSFQASRNEFAVECAPLDPMKS